MAAAWTSPALAASAAGDEVIIAGTRLPRPDLASDSAIRTVGGEQIVSTGAITLETVLNRLPQLVPSYSSAANNPSKNGVANVDLRGMGPSRNLVLLDGKRVIGADASNSVDLNAIPLGLIERIEVVTGGASAVYGPDAVTGVVNITLKRRFEGLKLDVRAGVSERGDGETYTASLTAGRRLGPVELMGAFTWSRREQILKSARPFSSQPESPSSFIPTGGWFPSPQDPPSQAAINAVFAKYGVAPGKVGVRNVAGFSFNADGTLFATGLPNNPAFDVQNFRGLSADVGSNFYPDVYAFNFQPYNKLILPLESWSGALFARAQPTDRLTLYARGLFTRYDVATELAPPPAPTENNPLYPDLNVFGFTIPVTNPFMPADLAQILASRTRNTPALAGTGPNEEILYRFRSLALGSRLSSNRADTINLLGGGRYELGQGWQVEAFASWGRFKRSEDQDGLISVRRVEALLDSPSGGKDICEGGFNPFGVILSDACRDYLRVVAHYSTANEQTNAVATLTGEPFRLPAGPVRAVAGVEFRRVTYAFNPPTGFGPGEVAGFNSVQPLSGSVRYWDLFGEVALPLLDGLPLAQAVEATLGYRRSIERTTGGVDSFKAELGWTVVPQLRLRASVQRAVRAPDILERFEAPHSDFAVATDPCAEEASPSAATLAFCLKQALAMGFAPDALDGFSQPEPEVSVLNHGNPNVRPERATTWTVGAVWRPGWGSAWLGGVTATADAYWIDVDGAIGHQDPQLIINGCYNLGGASNPSYDLSNPSCLKLKRSGVDFALFDIDAPQSNQAALQTAGLDLSVSFRTDLALASGRSWAGRLDTRVSAGWLSYFRQQASAAQPLYDFAGTIAGSSTPYQSLPRWKGEGEIAWSSGPAQLTLLGRYVGPMGHRAPLIDPANTTATGVNAAWYWDLAGRWTLSRRLELRAGVVNLFDRAPELYFPSVDAGTEPSTYDVIGRRFWLSLSLRL